MESWLITLISLASSTAITTILGALIKHTIDKKFKEQTELQDLRAEKERRERKQDVIGTIQEELKPLNDKVDHITNRIDVLAKGEQAGLRHNLYEIYDNWYKKGYCPREVKADFSNTYESYHMLGKNGVMDGCYERLMALPEESQNNKGE